MDLPDIFDTTEILRGGRAGMAFGDSIGNGQ